MDNATKVGLDRDDSSSQSSILKKIVQENEYCQHRVLQIDNDSDREHLVYETNLTQQSNGMAEHEITSDQLVESPSDRTDRKENVGLYGSSKISFQQSIFYRHNQRRLIKVYRLT